jgi:2-oxoglutarate dehydrogenase E2 component (dihydrolipoamide succinyltransferase)
MTGPGSAEIATLLATALHDAIAAQLPEPAGTGPGATTLLFAAPGQPVDPVDFTRGNAVANRQAASLFVDQVPQPGAAFWPASYPFSTLYSDIVGSARPSSALPPDESALVSGRVSAARKLVENSRIGTVGGAATTYLPTDQEPASWWDAAAPHWSSLNTPDPVTPPPAPPNPPPSWEWKVKPRKPGGGGPGPEGPPIIVRPPEMSFAAVSGDDIQIGDDPAGKDVPPRDDLEAVPSTSTDIGVRLDYCYVTLRRGWLDPLWFRGPGWAVPGYPPRSIAAGDPTAGNQLLPATPVGFVVVKNVAITADWTAGDTQLAPEAIGYGPFHLAGATFVPVDGDAQAMATAGDGGARATLLIPGVQVLAWACEIPQPLPPAQP